MHFLSSCYYSIAFSVCMNVVARDTINDSSYILLIHLGSTSKRQLSPPKMGNATLWIAVELLNKEGQNFWSGAKRSLGFKVIAEDLYQFKDFKFTWGASTKTPHAHEHWKSKERKIFFVLEKKKQRVSEKGQNKSKQGEEGKHSGAGRKLRNWQLFCSQGIRLRGKGKWWKKIKEKNIRKAGKTSRIC